MINPSLTARSTNILYLLFMSEMRSFTSEAGLLCFISLIPKREFSTITRVDKSWCEYGPVINLDNCEDVF